MALLAEIRSLISIKIMSCISWYGKLCWLSMLLLPQRRYFVL